MHSTPVLVVSASAALRSRLRLAIEARGSPVLATAGTLRALLERSMPQGPAWVVADLVDLDVLRDRLVEEVQRRHPKCRILLLDEGAPEQPPRAIGAGVELLTCRRRASADEFSAWVAERLVPRLRPLGATAFTPRNATNVPRAEPQPEAAMPAATGPRMRPWLPGSRPHVLAVASSTGGPDALAKFFSVFPGSFPLPVVVVQHMPAGFTRVFADRLDQLLELEVREAHGGEVLTPGCVWIAPGDHHLVVERKTLGGPVTTALDDGPPECSCRPAADVLFRSVARVYGEHAIATVLTGMGQDGYVGAQHLVEHDVPVLAQDEASSVVWGMPGKIVQSGLASFIGTPEELGTEIVRRCALLVRR